MPSFKHASELSHFFRAVLATGLALLLFLILLLVLRAMGWHGAIEPFGVIERLIDAPHHADTDPLVNVEYRDAAGVILNLGPHVTAELRNGRGRWHKLRDGVFVECDPRVIRAGSVVTVTILDGLIRESLRVQVDPEAEMLFVQSALSLTEVLNRINGPEARSPPRATPPSQDPGDR